MTSAARPGEAGPAGAALECASRLDQCDAFGPMSPRGTLRVADGILSWQPRAWRTAVWHVPCAEVDGGAASALSPFELWLEPSGIGRVAVALEPPGGPWAVGGGNVPDLRGQAVLDEFVEALRASGARIVGEPRSLSSRPGTGHPGLLWPF